MARKNWSLGVLLVSGIAVTATASDDGQRRIALSTQSSAGRTEAIAEGGSAHPDPGIAGERKGTVTQAVSFAPTSANDLGYFAIRGVERTIEIGIDAALPASAAFSVPIDSLLPASTASFALGQDFATTEVAVAGGHEQAPGVYGIELGTPSDASVGVAPPTSTTLELRSFPPTREDTLGMTTAKLAPAFCAVECTYYSSCGYFSGRSNSPQAKAGISAPSSFGDFNEIDTLRAFRDDVLADSATGGAYIALYERHGYELGLVMFADPTFFGHFRNAKDAWMPAIDSLVNGDGSAVIDATMIAAMEQTFAHYRTYGSARLREAIDENYALLQPGAFEGQTIAELAAHWATLPASPEVWGDGFDGP